MARSSDPLFNQLMDRYFDSDRHPQFLYRGSQESIIEELKAWVCRRKKVYKEQMELRDQCQKSTKELMSSPSKAREPGYVRAVVSRQARITLLDNEDYSDGVRTMYLLDTLKSRGVTWPKLWWRPEIDGAVCSFLGTVDEGFDAAATLTILEAREEEERLQATAAEIDLQTKAKEAASKAKFGTKARLGGIAGITAMAEASKNAGKGQVSAGRGGTSGSPGTNAEGDARPGGKPGGKPAVVKRAEDKLMGFAAAVLTRGGNSNDGQGGDGQGKMSGQEKQSETEKETKGKATDSEQAKN